jgi:ubiquinone/menaquinone biosynthesis C-methylase UbiE
VGRIGIVFGSLLCAGVAAQETRRPNLFPPPDLGLIEAPDRDEWQKPDLIMDKLKIADGSKVGEIGSGGGWFTIRLARRVGPNGAVYAVDVQQLMVEATSRRVERENMPWVETKLGTPTDPKLPAALDAVVIVNGFREMDDPKNPEQIITLLENAARALNAQGCFGVVDFLPGSGGPGPAPEERARPEDVTTAAAAAGLRLLSRETIPPFVYLLVFGKDTSRCAVAS